MHLTGTKGDIGVAMATADLLKQGFQVLMPVSSTTPYDLGIYKDGKFLKVSVKFRNAVKNNSIVKGHIRRTIVKRYIVKHRRCNSDEVDIICIYCQNTNECYYEHVKNIKGSSLIFRLVATKNNQTEKIRLAENYRVCSLVG